MNKIGINSISLVKEWPENDFSPLIKKAASLGFDAIELFTAYLVNHPKEKIDEYRSISGDLGIELQFSTGLGEDQDLSSAAESIRQNGLAHVRKTLEIVSYLNGRVWGGLTHSAWSSKIKTINEKYIRRDIALKSVKEVIKYAEDNGILYCIESVNRFESFMINTAQEAVDFVNEVGSPNAKINLDTFHMNIEENDMIEALLIAGDKLGHLHVGENNRKLPGFGSADWDAMLKALKQTGYKGTISYEPFVLFGGGIADAVSLWRDLSNGATQEQLDEMMKKSIEFMRNRMSMIGL